MTHRWFLDEAAVAGLVEVSYRLELGLVLRSLVIAILGAYTAFHLVDRLAAARSTPAYLAWLAGGAATTSASASAVPTARSAPSRAAPFRCSATMAPSPASSA